MRRIDPPRRVFDADRKETNHRRKKSRNHDEIQNHDDFDLEYEKPPSDWREKVAQRSIGNTKLGAFQVTIRNSKEDDEEENITREISTSVPKKLIKDPIKVKSTGPIKKFQKVKTAISQDSDESDGEEEERRRKEKAKVELENLREATKASKAESVIHCSDYLFSHEDLEDLEDFNLPKDALQLAKMARFGRDRDGRNVLSILLDWKNVKAFVKDFSEESFQPIMQSLTLLIAAGADPMVADRLGKCCGHYLAEWRFTKERVDDHKHLQLPKRVKEILEELGFIELQCYKPNPLMKQQPSLLFPRDEDKNSFLHLLVKSNYKRNPVYKQENHCLFRAMQALLVSMKIPNVLWGMTAGRDKADLRSLFQQPGLFMEQNFNRIRAATQSPEIDAFFKKIPQNAVTKYSGRPSEKSSSDMPPSDKKPKTDPEKLDNHLSQSSNRSSRSARDDRERHREDRNKDRNKDRSNDRSEKRNGRSKRKSKSPMKKSKSARAKSSDSSRSSSPSDSEKYSGRKVQVIKKKNRSPTPKKKSRSPSPIIIKREKRKTEKSPVPEKSNTSENSSSRRRRRRSSHSSPEVRKRSLTPKKRKKSESPDPLRDEPNTISLDEEYLTDNDEVYENGDERKFTLNLQNDMLEVGISADDFIDDAIAMLPGSRPSSKRDRTESLKSHSRKRSTSHSPKRKKSSKRSPTPKKVSPVKEVSSKSSRSRDEKSRSERSRDNKSREDKVHKSRDRRKEEESKRDERVKERGSNDSRVREDKSRKSREKSRDHGSRERDKRKRETKDEKVPAPVPKPTDRPSSRRRRRSSESPEPQRKTPKRNDNRSRSPLRNFEKPIRKESRRESSPPETYKLNRKSPSRKSPIRKSPSRSERRDRLEVRDDRKRERKRNDDGRRRRTRSRSRDRKEINSRERPDKKSEDRNRRDRSDNRDKRERSKERKDDSQKWMRLANY